MRQYRSMVCAPSTSARQGERADVVSGENEIRPRPLSKFPRYSGGEASDNVVLARSISSPVEALKAPVPRAAAIISRLLRG